MSDGTTPQVGDKVKYRGPAFEGPAEGLFLGLHYGLADCGRVDLFRTHTLIVKLADLTVVARATYEPVEPPAPVFEPEPGTLWRTDDGLYYALPGDMHFLVRLQNDGLRNAERVAKLHPVRVVPVDAEKLATLFQMCERYYGRTPPLTDHDVEAFLQALALAAHALRPDQP